jgi:hypothetical protein
MQTYIDLSTGRIFSQTLDYMIKNGGINKILEEQGFISKHTWEVHALKEDNGYKCIKLIQESINNSGK